MSFLNYKYFYKFFVNGQKGIKWKKYFDLTSY
jgi:hypothetical protein